MIKGLSKYCLFCYIYHYQKGLYKDLQIIMEDDTIQEFKLLGLIETGYKLNKHIWNITEFGIDFFKDFDTGG